MGIDYIYPQFEVIRREERCTNCHICERQCANGVHRFDAERRIMVSDESKCVNCQRCVCFTGRRGAAACCCPPWGIPDIFRSTGTKY